MFLNVLYNTEKEFWEAVFVGSRVVTVEKRESRDDLVEYLKGIEGLRGLYVYDEDGNLEHEISV